LFWRWDFPYNFKVFKCKGFCVCRGRFEFCSLMWNNSKFCLFLKFFFPWLFDFFILKFYFLINLNVWCTQVLWILSKVLCVHGRKLVVYLYYLFLLVFKWLFVTSKLQKCISLSYYFHFQNLKYYQGLPTIIFIVL
jgi:hypothetical protein